jgi:AAA family ATP:ADP antiporter
VNEPAFDRNRAIVSSIAFFGVLCSFYVLRPLRNEMAVRTGVEKLPWLFSGTFVVMLLIVPLLAWAARKLSPKRLLPVVYSIVLVSLVLFYFVLQQQQFEVWSIPAFFIWLSVFNLSVVSLFWSLMADLFDAESAKRFFGRIAAGGSLGAVAGPAIAALLATRIGATQLVLVSALFLLLSVCCISWLARTPSSSAPRQQDEPMHTGLLAAIRVTLGSRLLLGLSLLVICYTTVSTFVYFEQTAIVGQAIHSSAQRTAWFASIDLIVNSLSIVLQLFGTSALVTHLGLAAGLAIAPALMGGGFVWLGISPTIGAVGTLQVTHRTGNYAFGRPGREMLFTHTDRATKYLAKNFVDTSVYRASDALGAWLFTAMHAIGWSLGTIAMLGIPVSLLWMVVGYRLGRRYDVGD